MKFGATSIEGVLVVDLERHVDARGSFARIFCTDELAAVGVDFEVVQANISVNAAAGTLRGIHVRRPPAPEAKIVRCVQGAIFDVVVDLRPESPTYLRHVAAELSAANGRALLIPERCGHGFLTIEPDSHVLYLHSAGHAADTELGLPYDDPLLAIEWPAPVAVVSDRDAQFARLDIAGEQVRAALTVS